MTTTAVLNGDWPVIVTPHRCGCGLALLRVLPSNMLTCPNADCTEDVRFLLPTEGSS